MRDRCLVARELTPLLYQMAREKIMSRCLKNKDLTTLQNNNLTCWILSICQRMDFVGHLVFKHLSKRKERQKQLAKE